MSTAKQKTSSVWAYYSEEFGTPFARCTIGNPPGERKLRELTAEVELNRTVRSVGEVSISQPSSTSDWDLCMGLTDDPEIVVDSPNSADAEVTAFLAENNISWQSSPYTW